ncbi:hypothetical protein IG631_06580 [Alternaria alternata]|nr:hypothetical protein IG631_06580 [Alternaria alternata]
MSAWIGETATRRPGRAWTAFERAQAGASWLRPPSEHSHLHTAHLVHCCESTPRRRQCFAKLDATRRPSATVDLQLGALHDAPASLPPHRPLPLEA